MPPTVVALVEDLFFLAKIQETAKAVGVQVSSVDARRGVAAIAEAHPLAIIIDLNSPSSVAWIQALKADLSTRDFQLVGFVSHVQEKVIADARAAGCDLVLARSAFTKQLPDLLRNMASVE